jgi:hypothetical protein
MGPFDCCWTAVDAAVLQFPIETVSDPATACRRRSCVVQPMYMLCCAMYFVMINISDSLTKYELFGYFQNTSKHITNVYI